MAEVEGSKDLISVLWSGADILRSKMDANEYKDYLLGIVFYKYLSDTFLIKVYDLIYDEKPKNLKAALDAYKEALEDESAEELKEQIKSECHYLIEPQLTYTCFADAARNNAFNRELLQKAFNNIEQSDPLFADLFTDIDLYSNRLGNGDQKQSDTISSLIKEIDKADLLNSDAEILGNAYEYLIGQFASETGKKAGEFYTPRAVTDFMAKMINPQIGEKMADFACGTGGFITSWLKELKKKVKTTEDEELYSNSIYGIEKKQFPYMLCITNMLLHDLDVPQVFHDNTLLRDVLDYTEDDQVDVILMNPPYGGSEKTEVKNHFPSDLASSETADLFMSVIMYRLKENGRAAVILPDGFLFGTDNAKVEIKKKLFSEFNVHTIIRMPGSVFSPYTSITTNILFFDRKGSTEETWFYRLDMPEGYKHFSKTKPMKLEHFAPAIEWWNNRHNIEEDGFDKARKYNISEIEDRNYNIDLCGYPHEEEEILPPKELIQQYQEKRASLNADIDRILAQITEILGIDLEDN